MKRLIPFLCLILALSACAAPASPTSTAPLETTPPEVSSTATVVTDFAPYEALFSFSAEPNWLARAIGCVFERPEEINLNYMFYLGVDHPGSWNEISAESRQTLLDQGFWEEMDIQIMPCAKLEEALQSTFGITLADVTIPDEWGYIEAEDAYCSNHNDAYFPGLPAITAVEDDGENVFLHYTIEGYYNTSTDEYLDSACLVFHLWRTEDGRLLAQSNLVSP